MNWILYFGLLLVGAGAGGGLVGFLLSRNLPSPGQHTGPMLPVPDREPTSLLTPPDGLPVAEQAAHADRMREISLPYLPNVQADRPVTPVRTGHSPWTGGFPQVTEDEIPDIGTLRREFDAYWDNEKRVRWARAELEALGDDPTPTGAQRVYAGMRAIPVTPADGFGVDRCEADVLAAEQQGLIA